VNIPRKTLTLKTAPASDAVVAPRKRAGARAKQVSQRERQQTQHQTQGQTPRPAPSPDTPPPRPNPTQRYTVFAPCPQGLEQVLVKECQTLGFTDAHAARAGCQFTTDWHGVLRANLYSRLATRILVRLAQAPATNEDAIFALAYDTPWENWFGPQQRLRVDTSAIRSPMRSLQFCNLRVKDGICDRLRDREGARPDVDTVRPDARVHLFLDETRATLYLDTTGESLFKRGWRLDKGQAPLRENLASGLLALAGWTPDQALLDPFCGSGTILIEAASIALNIPAGITRPFGFERLRHHDRRGWQDMKDQARAQIRPHVRAPLLGGDVQADLIAAARANARRAGLPADAMDWRVGDALRLTTDAPAGWILTNPPYGERMDAVQDTFWRPWSAQLKRHYAGWRLGVISSDMDFPRHLRLKPERRIPVHNGALECRLFLFEIVQNHYRQA